MPRMRPPCLRPPNGLDVKLHGQGLRAEANAAHGVAEPSLLTRILRDAERGGRGKGAAPKLVVRLTVQRFTCAARARVPKPTRRTACTHVSRAMQAARRRQGFNYSRRLGRRTEAGPRQVLP